MVKVVQNFHNNLNEIFLCSLFSIISDLKQPEVDDDIESNDDANNADNDANNVDNDANYDKKNSAESLQKKRRARLEKKLKKQQKRFSRETFRVASCDKASIR